MWGMASGIDPKGDYVFKRLCGDEDNALVLVDLLNAVLRFPAGRRVRGVALLNPFVERDYIEGKVPIVDVRARDDLGRQFLLEMQLFLRPGFANRLLYYWSGGHAEQLLKGERYEMLLPTYTICFLNETLFQDNAYHHTFRVYDDHNGVLLCKDLEIHLLELSKFDVAVEAVQTPLERWCYFFKHGASLDLANLPATLSDPMIRKAMEVLMKVSQDEIERHRAAERLKGERDAASLAADARVALEERSKAEERARLALEEARLAQEGARLAQEGARQAQEGAKVARQQALDKGQRIGRIQLLQQLLAQPETSSAELDQLPDEDLGQLEESLKRQLNGKRTANGSPPADKT
jgi:predicted transposase/invertase (TIGR01784 family)